MAGFEEVVAMGAKKFVLFGSCGVLDDEKVKDHIIIPVSAVRDEGTSYHYARRQRRSKHQKTRFWYCRRYWRPADILM